MSNRPKPFPSNFWSAAVREDLRRVRQLAVVTVVLLLGAAGYETLWAQERDRYAVLVLPDQATRRIPPELFPAMRQAGIKWGKVQFDRELIHLGPQRYDWSMTDELVAEAAANGVQLLGEMGMSPIWDTNEPGLVDYYAYPPMDYDQWADYVFQTVSRYKNHVRYWEFWNEIDWPPPFGFWNGTPAEYARLLAVSNREVKRADPTAKVLIGGFLEIMPVSVDFWRAIMTDPVNPAGQNFDIMSIHGYVHLNDGREKVIFWRSMTDKPLWVTEMGWPADPTLQTRFDPTFCCGEEGKARFLRTTMSEMVRLGADKVFWFALWVPENPWREWDSYGLLDRSFQPTPALLALRDLLSSLPP